MAVIRMLGFHLVRLVVEGEYKSAKGKPDPGDGRLAVVHSLSRHIGRQNEYRINLRVKARPPCSEKSLTEPRIEAEIAGYFQCPPEIPEDRREFLVRYNGILILYGILRG